MKRPALIGIVNVTPDSFSDGGRMDRAAIAHAEMLAHTGADILDIGAESTRPGAVLLTPDEEWARLEPVLQGIHAQSWRPKVRLSLDTRHAETARKALAFGLDIINDVSGCMDAAMGDLLREHPCDMVVMHALGVPPDPAVTLTGDPIAVVLAWKAAMMEAAQAQGIGAERLIFDPGIGFGKTARQSLELILRSGELVATHGRWLFGHSRKSFIRTVTPVDAPQRDEVTRAFSSVLAGAGVDYLRVHDVAGHRAMFDALCT
ncbi:MAG: dihydropteroate synthase [Pseudomonadota bacterium]